jgi:DNA-binding response OmpR family regulator
VENGEESGAIFTVRLPLSHESLRDAQPVSSRLDWIDSEAATLAASGDGVPASDSPGPAETDGDGVDERTALLIVDDNSEIRAYVRGHFEPQYRILEACDGREALEKTRSELPDIIISDVMMPDVDGFELVRRLRSEPETDFLPIILLTARAAEEDRLTGLNEGTDAYLTKPFSMRELHTRVDNLLASRKRLKERYTSGADAEDDTLSMEGLGDLSSSEQAYIERAREVILAHLDEEEFGVEDLADALAQSRSTVYRRLRDSIDLSPTAFIRTVRLKRAAVMLRESRGTVSEIAYAVGFKSVSHFSKSFSDQYGVVPSSYADAIGER